MRSCAETTGPEHIPSQLVDTSHGPPERPCDKLDPVLLSALTQESVVFEPAERIRQNPRQIEPMLSVPEQVIGPIVERKFENRKGVACRRLIMKRKMYGVSDGFRIPSDLLTDQQDQALDDAEE
jgi:hypothetical protein